MKLGLGPGHIVLDWDPDPPTERVTAPPLSKFTSVSAAHVYCGQTVGWIKIPFGTEVGLGPGHTVIDEDPAPPTLHPRKGGTAAIPVFGPCLSWPNGRP